jgi:acetoin utilization deacetylase AcuC-like enzyme
VLSVLEGGYDLEALASASLAHVEALTSRFESANICKDIGR